MYGPKRNHVLFLFDGFLENFGFPILALILLLGGNSSDSMMTLVIIIAVLPIKRFVEFMTTTFEINETYLIIRRGLFTKKKTEIPLSTITTVDLSQDLLFQMFKVYKIKIDNTAQANDAANQAEAKLVLKKEDALYVKQLLLSHRPEDLQEDSEPAPQERIVFDAGDFMLLGLLRSKIGYIFSVLFVPYVGGSLIDQSVDAERFIEDLLNGEAVGDISFTSAVIVILVLYLITLAFALLTNVIRYHRFTLSKKGYHLSIEYGLLQKKKYSFSLDKINGIRLKQNALMRIFKYYTMEVFVIGYGDEKAEKAQETAMLIPIAKRDRVENLLEKLLPDFELPKSLSKPQKRALPYFFLSFRFLAALLLLAGSLFTQNMIFVAGAAVLLALAAVGEVLEYKTEGLSINKKNVAVANGRFTYRTTIVKTGSIESVRCTASMLKRKKGICHIAFGFWGPKMVANPRIRNMNISDYEALTKAIEF